jgi:hypothetical protein
MRRWRSATCAMHGQAKRLLVRARGLRPHLRTASAHARRVVLGGTELLWGSIPSAALRHLRPSAQYPAYKVVLPGGSARAAVLGHRSARGCDDGGVQQVLCTARLSACSCARVVCDHTCGRRRHMPDVSSWAGPSSFGAPFPAPLCGTSARQRPSAPSSALSCAQRRASATMRSAARWRYRAPSGARA